jgi:hypothetical protein
LFSKEKRKNQKALHLNLDHQVKGLLGRGSSLGFCGSDGNSITNFHKLKGIKNYSNQPIFEKI